MRKTFAISRNNWALRGYFTVISSKHLMSWFCLNVLARIVLPVLPTKSQLRTFFFFKYMYVL